VQCRGNEQRTKRWLTLESRPDRAGVIHESELLAGLVEEHLHDVPGAGKITIVEKNVLNLRSDP